MARAKVPHFETPYPVDAVGVPIAPEELGFKIGQVGEWNNHHLAYFRRMFATLAISQTFRDLSIMQQEMPVTEHRRLHNRFVGIALPKLITMMDIIDGERQSGGTLKQFDVDRPAGERYHLEPITDARWAFLNKEYNHHRDV